LSGLLVGALDRRAQLIEAQPTLPHNHHAVLRFREDKISRALNIPFRKVRVLKAVWRGGQSLRHVTPDTANLYARKVTGIVTERSILDLAVAERFIAPQDFIPQLADMCAGRIELGRGITEGSLRELPRPLISTIPLPAMLTMTAEAPPDMAEFQREPVRVMKFRVAGADVFQTVYYPDAALPAYRVTLTGDEMIVECSGAGALTQYHLEEIAASFGLELKDLTALSTHRQQLGKILPLPAPRRKALLLHLSRTQNIYSLGRFACWRNILLDDVYEDYFRIRNMMALNEYDIITGIAKYES